MTEAGLAVLAAAVAALVRAVWRLSERVSRLEGMLNKSCGNGGRNG